VCRRCRYNWQDTDGNEGGIPFIGKCSTLIAADNKSKEKKMQETLIVWHHFREEVEC
jgi:hypothetical protein